MSWSSSGRRRTASALSVALDVDELTQGVPNLDERARIGHHLVDRLVRLRDLIDEGIRVAVLDADHRLPQLLLVERLARSAPGELPTGAVRGAMSLGAICLDATDEHGG